VPLDASLEDVRRLASAVAHELRTPLAALSAEIEIGLRRDRTPAAYREILSRVADRVGELVDLSRDLAVVADPDDGGVLASRTASVPALCDVLAAQHAADRVAIRCDPGALPRVVGDEALLSRALALLVRHAVRQCPANASVRVVASAASDAGAIARASAIVIHASPVGFPPHVWADLAAVPSPRAGRGLDGPAMLRLLAAWRIIEGCGGRIDVEESGGQAVVRVKLRAAMS
jgi:signal transduction histidine kinase